MQEVLRDEIRIGFHKNWRSFIAKVDNDRIREAEKSLRSLLGLQALENKTFLEIGSGGGLFSLAAQRLDLMLYAIVHPADIQDRDGGILVIETLFGVFRFLKTLFADGGYQGPQFSKAITKVVRHHDVETIKRSDRVKGFVVLRQRCIVERTIAWLNRCRRLGKD